MIYLFPLQSETRKYSYRVKIINPLRKSDAIIRELRKFTGRFSSITEVKVRIMEEFGDYVPESTRFSIGYYEGQTKRWICAEDDLSGLYDVYSKQPGKEIVLWCEGRQNDQDSGDDSSSKAKRKKIKDDGHKSKREEKEDNVKVLAEELQEQHKDKLDLNEVQYRLWSRMIITGVHSSKDVPPQIPLIVGTTPKKPKHSAFEETIMNTANAMMKAVSKSSQDIRSTQIQNINDCQIATGISPGKAVDIRGKSLGQLATLKQLFIDGVLSEQEFEEQKDIILGGLKKLK